MLIPDINLLIYAYNETASKHKEAKKWWESSITQGELIAIPWVVINGFIRLTTHPRVFESPLKPKKSFSTIESWFNFPNVQTINPGHDHLSIIKQLLIREGVGGNLVTDAHLAAIAIEHQCELHSNDSDFGRFPGLRWVNPIK